MAVTAEALDVFSAADELAALRADLPGYQVDSETWYRPRGAEVHFLVAGPGLYLLISGDPCEIRRIAGRAAALATLSSRHSRRWEINTREDPNDGTVWIAVRRGNPRDSVEACSPGSLGAMLTARP